MKIRSDSGVLKSPVHSFPMNQLTDKAAWRQLEAHYQTVKDRSITDLFSADDTRFERFSLDVAGLFCDYSKNHLSEQTLSLLSALADACDLRGAIERLFSGDSVNVSEQRAAWHTALRDKDNPHEMVQAAFSKMRHWVDAIREKHYLGATGKPITDIVHVGIGGSYLGPAVVYDAFSSISDPLLRCHFITNENQQALSKKLSSLDPSTTLVIIVSKSFTTAETMVNAKRILFWLQSASDEALQKQLLAVTASIDHAVAFGVLPDHIFPMWEWVGGRYSLWSSVGLSIAIAFGWDLFSALLSGAQAMDQHFRSKPWSQNLPVILGLLGIWYRNFFNTETRAIIPYHHALRLLPPYLQQLHMESLGKSVTQAGEPVDYATGAVIWGGVGPSSQHSFHQLFLQGKYHSPIDFVVTQEDRMQYVNCLAQASVLMQGNVGENITAHQRILGNVPSNIFVMEKITPFSLGALLAMYEHKVFVQSVIWDIDAFDQWGVECGKQLAKQLLSDDFSKVDASTRELMRRQSRE